MRKLNFTQALINNIHRSYSYTATRNRWGHHISPEKYDPLTFFESVMDSDPFEAFMFLDHYGFKRAKRDLDRYGIPYTPDQLKAAQAFDVVTTVMQVQRRDVVGVNFGPPPLSPKIAAVGAPNLYTTHDTIDAQKAVKRLNLTNQGMLPLASEVDDPHFIKEQRDALELLLTHRHACLIGGAGTGKSYLTAKLVAYFGDKAHPLAPTHKARINLQDKLGKKGAVVETVQSFIHKQDATQQGRVLIIDEAGMLSSSLVAKLAPFFDTADRVYFIGDKNQLPPIGYGRPFERLQTVLPCAELYHNHRSESADIVMLGREILGEPYNDQLKAKNIVAVPTVEAAFKAGADVVLTHTNGKVDEINETKRLRHGTPAVYPEWRVGEKIVAYATDYRRRRRFYNGELFDIVAPNLLRGAGGKVVAVTRDDLRRNFKPAYGLTIHKAQGSEWPCVAYLPNPLDSQNLAYTAVTRARQKLIIIGRLNSSYPPERTWQQLNL